jgi:hypothetical protein
VLRDALTIWVQLWRCIRTSFRENIEKRKFFSHVSHAWVVWIMKDVLVFAYLGMLESGVWSTASLSSSKTLYPVMLCVRLFLPVMLSSDALRWCILFLLLSMMIVFRVPGRSVPGNPLFW